jgi:hypothetical protein
MEFLFFKMINMDSGVFNGKAVYLLCLTAVIACASANAQQLPTSSRTVFKCNVNGSTVYSDTPCLGAQKIDVEPSRGADSLSGRKKVGSDISRERNHEMIVEAVRPITGMNVKEIDTFGRRMNLRPEAQRECKSLDNDIPAAERDEANATPEIRSGIQARLLTLRQRYRDLRC